MSQIKGLYLKHPIEYGKEQKRLFKRAEPDVKEILLHKGLAVIVFKNSIDLQIPQENIAGFRRNLGDSE